jgi:hypothetical protein
MYPHGMQAEDADHVGGDTGAYYGDFVGEDSYSDDDYGAPARKKAAKKPKKGALRTLKHWVGLWRHCISSGHLTSTSVCLVSC